MQKNGSFLQAVNKYAKHFSVLTAMNKIKNYRHVANILLILFIIYFIFEYILIIL